MNIDGKILWVAGGRDYDHYKQIQDVLWAEKFSSFDAIITGAARGADLTAEEVWKDTVRKPYIGIPAQWKTHGKSAGYRRNSEIAHMLPDALLVFPGGAGTQHSIDLATELRIPIERAYEE